VPFSSTDQHVRDTRIATLLEAISTIPIVTPRAGILHASPADVEKRMKRPRVPLLPRMDSPFLRSRPWRSMDAARIAPVDASFLAAYSSIRPRSATSHDTCRFRHRHFPDSTVGMIDACGVCHIRHARRSARLDTTFKLPLARGVGAPISVGAERLPCLSNWSQVGH